MSRSDDPRSVDPRSDDSRPDDSRSADPRSGRDLFAAARGGNAEAARALVRELAPLVWTACRRPAASDADAEPAFRDVMTALAADAFARLEGFDGRAPFRVHAALVVRDILCERAVALLFLDAARGWRAFEAVFGADIERMMRRMLPRDDHRRNREDAYQTVREALLANHYQRLRGYSGRGSLSGFVLRTVEHLIVDFIRSRIMPRRRVPAAIECLADLEQTVFRLIFWDGVAADAAQLAPHLARPGAAPPDAVAVAAAIERVRQTLPNGWQAQQTIPLSAVEDAVCVAGGAEAFAVATPEDNLIARQAGELLEDAIAVLVATLPELTVPERRYLQFALQGLPAREIARIAGCPVEDIHRVAGRLKRRLRDKLGADAVMKKWLMSV